MPIVIPDATSIAPENFSGIVPVARVANAGAPGLAIAQAGQDVVRAGTEVDHAQRIQGEFQAAHADAQLQTAIAQQQALAEQNPDYTTVKSKYDDAVSEARAKIASTLTNPFAVSQFNFMADQHVAREGTIVQGMQIKKTKDAALATVDSSLADLHNVAVSGDITSATSAANALIDSSVSNGYLSPTQAEQTKRQWNQTAVVGRINAMPPELQAEALKEPWAQQYLPDDKRAEMIRQAQETSRAGEAAKFVETQLNAGASPSAIFARAQTAYPGTDDNSALQRQAIRDEAIKQTAQKVELETKMRTDALNRFVPAVVDGTLDPQTGLTPLEKSQLGSSYYELVNMSKKAAQGGSPYAKYTDPNVLYSLMQAKANGDYAGVRNIVNSNFSKLSEGDFRLYGGLGLDGTTSVQNKGLFDIKDELLNRMVTSGYVSTPAAAKTSAGYATAQKALSDWYQTYVQVNGKVPTDQEKTAQIDKLMMPSGQTGFFGGSIPYVDSNPGIISVDAIRQRDPVGFNATAQANPSIKDADQIVSMYKQGNAELQAIAQHDPIGYKSLVAKYPNVKDAGTLVQIYKKAMGIQ